MAREYFKLIACNVMWRELCHFAAVSKNRFDFQFLPWGLHTEPDNLRAEVQRRIDAVPENTYDAVLLGYGLCSNGLVGITARHTRLVIFRGHDCITCFLGSKERYREYFDANPGAYWYTPGWIENHPAPGQERYEQTYRQYVEKFGEDNAQYLMEFLIVEPGRMIKASNQEDILLSGVKDGGRFSLREGNNLPPCVPLDNLRAVYAACLEFGRYQQ